MNRKLKKYAQNNKINARRAFSAAESTFEILTKNSGLKLAGSGNRSQKKSIESAENTSNFFCRIKKMKVTRSLWQKLASAANNEAPHQKSSLTAVRYGVRRGDFAQLSDTDLSFFERVLGKSNVITEDLDAANNDWLGCYQGIFC